MSLQRVGGAPSHGLLSELRAEHASGDDDPLVGDVDSNAYADVGIRNLGVLTNLALADLGSTKIVHSSGPHCVGDVNLISHGDQPTIYFIRSGFAHQRLALFTGPPCANDTAWPNTQKDRLNSTDSTGNSVDVVTGQF